jgi:hypothetical protein
MPMHPGDLKILFDRRTAAFAALSRFKLPLRECDLIDRVVVERHATVYRECDRQIVAALKEHPAPVRFGEVTLCLTADRDHFAVLDPATLSPTHSNHRMFKHTANDLFDYTPVAKGA